MKFITAALVIASASALQAPVRKAFGAAAVASTAFVASPLAAPAATVTPASVVVNVKSDIEPIAAAKNVFAHRNQLQIAVKDFIGDVKQLQSDVDGVFPPAPEVNVAVPEDWKQAVRDALVGQARLVVNDEPIYFEMDSKEGFLTVKVLSPLLPRLPLLEPTDEQRASMVIPRAAPAAVVTKEATQVATTDGKPFWEWAFTVPGTQVDVTLPEAAVGLVASAYATTFGYYTVSRALDEQQAEKKKQANKAKAAAARKAREAAAAATPATDSV